MTRRMRTALAFSLFFLLSAPVLADDPAAAPRLSPKVRSLMQDRDYAAAVVAIDAELQKEDTPTDYLIYLKGRAYHLQEQYDKAVQTFDELAKKHPDSPWARRARFARGASFARKGDFLSAEQVYQQEATYLLSAERKQELADIYLDFADAYFEPADQQKQPDFTKALQFYQKALEVGPQPEKRAEVELLVGRCFEKLGNWDEAIARYTQFLKDHPDGALDVEARYRLGHSQLMRGRHADARRTWEDLLAKHRDAKSERIAEATYKIALTYQIPKPPSNEDLSLGVAALEKFIERYPEHKLASGAHLNIAQSYLNAGRFEDATTGLKRLLADGRYRKRKEIPQARFLLGRCYQAQKKLDQALAAWREYLVQHPADQRWSEAQRAILDTEFLMAEEKRAAKEYEPARKLYLEFLAKYPLDSRAPQIMYLLGAIEWEQEKWDAAIDAWRQLVSKYPKTNPSSRGQLMIGVALEDKLNRFEEALKEYRKVTWGRHQAEARQRIARLTAKQMSIATRRVFRTDETPHIDLETRNVESVTVRAYVIDLETYFRKMHLATGVEGLDISLIDPDKTFEFKVPDYAEHRQIESEIPLPVIEGEQGGVLAVTVSTKTLEATTLVLRSDLDVVVKSSRDEVFVFAQNMRTGKPWPQARLLVSNGQKVFAEGQTGDDGVFQKSYEQLKSANDVRVFAVADGSVASNVVGLRGIGVAQGLASKGYLYTDRPAYRAGQMVHVRGVIRRVAGDAYRIDADKTFDLSVFDARNRLVWQKEVKLNEFGSFHAHFELPATSPQGNYRIQAQHEDKEQYQGTFAVHEYRIAEVQLAVDTPRRVYYRGEEIEGTISAKFYYGAPLAGRELRYQLGGGRTFTAKTDSKGEVKFKLPTRDFRETQVLPLTVTLAERNLQLNSNFIIATRGFAISVETVRPVYLAGETFEVTLRATDAEGKPAKRKLTLSALEVTKVNGQAGERLVEKHEAETDAKDGTARVTLKLPDGGRYILRAEGTDRFENPITGQFAVQVSGDDDKVRLRLLADRHTYKVGETAQVDLHWREQPALALVTYQGAKVLGHRLVDLREGSNPLDLPMTAALAPNFDLSVAVMTDKRPAEGDDRNKPVQRFHMASSPFAVERELLVKVESKRPGDAKGPAQPGDSVDVTVTTTDPQGKPVAAELSVALVEKSLLDRFPSQIAKIQDFFRGTARQSAVRTTASISFGYRPKTQPINPQLLAEKDRLELKQEEEKRLLAASLHADFDSLRRPVASRVIVQESLEVVDDSSVPFDDRRGADDEGDPFASPQSVRAFASSGEGRGGDVATNGQSAARFRKSLEQGQTSLGRISGSVDGVTKSPAVGAGFYYRVRGPRDSLTDAPSFDIGSLRTSERRLRASNLFSNGVHGPGPGHLIDGKMLLGVGSNSDHSGTSVQFGDGSVAFLNLGDLDGDADKAERLARQLVAARAVLMPGLARQETGYWNPAVRTDEQGKATVSFDLPDRSTAWKLEARGVTTDTLAGQGDAELVAKKELFGELKLPLAFTDGDQTDVVATVHNSAVKEGQIKVTLKTTIGEKSSEETKTIDVTDAGLEELTFKAKLDLPEGADAKATPGSPDVAATFLLTVTSGDRRDRVRQVVPIRPYGMPVFRTASGAAQGDTTAWVELPGDMPVVSPRLQVVVGPNVQKSLLDVLFASPIWCQVEANRLASGLDTTASDLMAALALQELLGTTRDAANAQTQAIDARIRSTIGALVSAQQDGGGWSWTGYGKETNRYISARIVWALALARSAGYTVPDDAYQRALHFLRQQLTETRSTDYESKAVLLHALTTTGQDDFALANRLYRDRESLSSAALVYLALAFAEMDRKPVAQELLAMLDDRDLVELEPKRRAARSSLPWSHAPAELMALQAVALEKTAPGSPKTGKLVEKLLASRTGHRWSPEKATGPATLAACRWYARDRFENERYELAVFVNDHRVKVLEVAKNAVTQTIDVPVDFLIAGKQRVNFQLTGRGRYTYQCVLGGFVAADKLKSTTRDWEVRREYEPAPLELDGQPIPRGFGVVQGNYRTFRNPLSQLPVGKRGHVRLQMWRSNVQPGTPEEDLEYLVVTDPLPSGATVVEDSVRGGFERFEVSPGAITFYVGNRRHMGNIEYDLHGYAPGSYRAAPTVMRNAYRPEQLAVWKPKPLSVLPLGAKSGDAYRLTPQELFELGKRHFAKQQMPEAAKHLKKLLADWNLRPEVYKESARILLDAHLALDRPNEVVRYFEIIKETWPELEISFDKILKVGAAYHEMGEYERSYRIFRATAESSFMRESRVAGFLAAQGEFLTSVEVMGRLLREYPPEPYVAAATYALAQEVFAQAPEAASDAKLREAKLTRVDLVRQAHGMLSDFLTAYPDDPAADQAAFSALNARLELEQFEVAIADANRYAKRYPESKYLDSYWYVIGYCHFARAEHQAALDMCRQVAETKHKDPKTGRMVDSDNRPQAIYILGQVYHSLGKAAEAIREYSRVKDQFADAREAIDYFARRAIKLPEVTTVVPGKEASVELTFRNVARCDTKVYRIDLMKYSLLKRNLSEITRINLAGIHPLDEKQIELGDGKDYRDRTLRIDLPLEEQGAYLVVCRGENLHTSGLVLVSPLAVDVQEDRESGRVRTTVKDVTDDGYVTDVHVKVIGSDNRDFLSGQTDLRGVYTADAIRGTSTVIAMADADRYAFYRGKTPLGPTKVNAPSQRNDAIRRFKRGKGAGADSNGLLKGIQGGNSAILQEQQSQLKQVYENPVQGVQVESAK